MSIDRLPGMDNNYFVAIKGSRPGRTSVVLGGVHGQEIAGPETLKALLASNLTIDRGTVFLGYGNPESIPLGRRDSKLDKDLRPTEEGVNLNRMFKPADQMTQFQRDSYEFARARVIEGYLDQAEGLYDVHGTESAPEHTIPLIICESNGYNIARYLPMKFVVRGFDEYEAGGTDYYMNQRQNLKSGIEQGIGICGECGSNDDPMSVIRGILSTYAFLTARGHIEGNLDIVEQEYYELDGAYITKSNNYRRARLIPDFSPLRGGEVIAYDGEKPVIVGRDTHAIFFESEQIDQAGEEAGLWLKRLSPEDFASRPSTLLLPR